MKGFSPSSIFALSRNETQPSGHTISFTCLSEPPTFLRSPPLLMASINTDSISLLIHWTAIGAGIFIANFFLIAAEAFWLISSQIPCNLNFKLVFFIQPFIHIAALITSDDSLSIPLYLSLCLEGGDSWR